MGAGAPRMLPTLPVTTPVLVVLGLAAGLVGLGALGLAGLAASTSVAAAALVALPVLAVIGVLVLWNTQLGLCAAAFAIAPLGIIQYEAVSVTINLPEALILTLFCRQAALLLVRGERVDRYFPLIPVGIYAVVSIVSLAVGIAQGNGFRHALQDFRQFTEYLTLFWLVVQCVQTRRQATQLIGCFVLGVTLIALHGILQRYTGIGIPRTQLASDLVYHAAIRSGSFYGATPLGGLLVLAILPAIGLMLARREWVLRVLFASCAVIGTVAIVFTNTRASWLALALGLVLLLASIRLRPRLVALAAAGAVVFTAFLGPLVAQRMATLEISRTERSLLERINYYTVAWHIFRAHPVFGLGYGCYYELNPILLNRRYVPAPRVEGRDATVHSAYLQILVKTGLVGLAAFALTPLWWLGLVWRERGAVRDRGDPDHILFAALVAAIVGYLFHSGFENFFQWPVMAQAFWLLFGVSVVLARLVMERSESKG